MFSDIIRNVTRHVTLTPEEEQAFTGLLERRQVPKKTILLREGEICRFEAYVRKGCIRTYYIDENGFEMTLQFATEDWWVSDIASFYEQKPSKLFIETLEDCEVLQFTLEAKEQLLKTFPRFERYFRIILQRNLSALQHRLINTITLNATDKYREFIRIYPAIPQRVPQYYIASYLGISAELVSKIRKKLSHT